MAAALEQYKKDQATAIRKTLVFYAGLKNQNITNIGKDIPNYKVPAKTIKKVVAEDRDAPGLIRDLQQIVNGTRAGRIICPICSWRIGCAVPTAWSITMIATCRMIRKI